MADTLAPPAPTPAARADLSPLKRFIHRWQGVIRTNLYIVRDVLAPLLIPRWAFTAFLLLTYIMRVWMVGGFYIVTYALGIYLLNLLVVFLMPQLEMEEEDADLLPTRADDEFRPFIRKLPEFRFWRNVSTGLFVALVCTFVPFLDLPVFWPILLIYFVILTIIQLKARIKHMWKHRYVPFSLGKPRYPGKTVPAVPAASKS